MIKVYINNEEVLCDKNIVIKKEMLNTSSTILNNVYPKSWETTHDYTTNYYYPLDYSNCKITDIREIPAEEGQTIEGTNFNINVDLSKEYSFDDFKGNTTQEGTPTPTNPVNVNVVTGEQDIVVCGKNLFDKTRIISGKRLDKKGLPSISDNSYCTTDYFIAVEPNITYFSSALINMSKAVCFYDSNQNFIERVMHTQTNTFTTGSTTHYIKMSILLSEIDTQQLEKGNQATTY